MLELCTRASPFFPTLVYTIPTSTQLQKFAWSHKLYVRELDGNENQPKFIAWYTNHQLNLKSEPMIICIRWWRYVRNESIQILNRSLFPLSYTFYLICLSLTMQYLILSTHEESILYCSQGIIKTESPNREWILQFTFRTLCAVSSLNDGPSVCPQA